LFSVQGAMSVLHRQVGDALRLTISAIRHLIYDVSRFARLVNHES
jgi:hypothetical protein